MFGKWQFHSSWTFLRRGQKLPVFNPIPTIHSFSVRYLLYRRYNIFDSQVVIQKAWVVLFRFTGLRIQRKTKIVNYVLKASFSRAKEQVTELSITKAISFIKDSSTAINTMDGVSLTTMKDNGLQEKSAVMASIKATMQSGTQNPTLHMKGTGKTIDSMGLEPKTLPSPNLNCLCLPVTQAIEHMKSMSSTSESGLMG